MIRFRMLEVRVIREYPGDSADSRRDTPLTLAGMRHVIYVSFQSRRLVTEKGMAQSAVSTPRSLANMVKNASVFLPEISTVRPFDSCACQFLILVTSFW